MNPILSIGMPVYNAERWLADGIESMQRQTFADFELVISDNASTDSSLEIARRYADADKRIRILRQPRNIGANGNYSAVLADARGDLFKWASVNDLCAPEFLRRCVESLQADPDAVLACPRTILFENTPSDGAHYDHDFALLSQNPVRRFIDLLNQIQLNNAMNGVIRREALTRVLGMGTFRSADYLLMAELALCGKFLLIDEPMFLRRMSAEASTLMRGKLEAEKHLDPRAKRPRLWQHWRYHLRLLRIACRLPPFGFASWGTIDFALRRIVWSRRELADDVRTALSRLVAG
jgi:glycosyltransferase involved in cell wall biosynthesis